MDRDSIQVMQNHDRSCQVTFGRLVLGPKEMDSTVLKSTDFRKTC